MPPAARVGDMHICPMVTPGLPPIPHVGGPIMPPGTIKVLLGGQPAAAFGNMCTCVGPPAPILKGSTGVFVGNMPSARIGDQTGHGGAISIGLPTVMVGEINMALMTPPNIAIIMGMINPTNSLTNCADIIPSVIALFRGNGGLVAAVGPGQTDAQINAANNTTIGPYNTSINAVFANVQAGGPGTVQIMTIDYGNGGGHVVAVANVNGTVGVMEGQNWGPGAGNGSGFITDPAVANARYGGPGTTFATGNVP